MAKFKYSPEEKKVLNSMFWNAGLCFSSFNMVKMEGNAFALTMSAALDELYDNEEERNQARVRHNGFFNTHSVMLSLIAGITYALEKEKKNKGTVDDDAIESIKVALMGPTAGIGDAFFFNCIRVIAAGIGIGMCAQGNILGTIIFITLYGGSQLLARWYLTRAGYSLGLSFVDSVFESGLMDAVTKSASIIGLTMVGAMVATMVNVKLAWTINAGDTSVNVLSVVDSIMPGILSIILVFVLVKFIKKGVRPVTLVIAILIISVALAAIGVF